MRRLRRIKILATLGPVSSDSAMIRRLFEAGADVFRINMSHTSHDKMRELVKTIRNVESSYGRPIGILVDLQGPKLRLGSFAEGSIQLNNGETFVLDSDKTPGDNSRNLAGQPSNKPPLVRRSSWPAQIWLFPFCVNIAQAWKVE